MITPRSDGSLTAGFENRADFLMDFSKADLKKSAFFDCFCCKVI